MDTSKRLNWSDFEIKQMLEIIRKKKIFNLQDGRKYRPLKIYKVVSRDLNTYNINRTPEQIRTKVKALKKLYYKVKRNNKKIGVGDGAKAPAGGECIHYDILDELFGDQEENKVITPEPERDPFEIETVDSKYYNRSSSLSSSSNSYQPRRKKSKVITEEEKLMEMHHKWLEKEFEKQRQFEKDLVEDFKNTIKDTIRDLSQQLQSRKS